MKTKTFILVLLLIMAVSVFLLSCATTKKAIPEEDFFEAFSGTWVNIEYSGFHDRLQKRINYPDGTWEFYRTISNTKPFEKGQSTIIDKWIDSKGDILYKAQWESLSFFGILGYEMGKISNSGHTLELLFPFGDEPIEEWKPDYYRYTYWIYYRQ